MPVLKYRSVEDMPPPWRRPDDPANLRLVALMLSLGRRFRAATTTPPGRRVQRFSSFEEARAAADAAASS